MNIQQAVRAALADVGQWSVYRLADEAECSSPASTSSDGAQMLDSVRTETVDLIAAQEEDIDGPSWFDSVNDNGSVNEIADGAPSIYTHTRWVEFADLGAYNEDPTELGFDGSDMLQGAAICLYIIAERLATAILNHIREAAEAADLDDEGGEDD